LSGGRSIWQKLAGVTPWGVLPAQAVVKVLKDRVSHPMAKAQGVSVLNQVRQTRPLKQTNKT
jgi:hypothetical protein